jgi:hypothetical protein
MNALKLSGVALPGRPFCVKAYTATATTTRTTQKTMLFSVEFKLPSQRDLHDRNVARNTGICA